MNHPATRVLFVCTANICRSPYAERRARQALGEHAEVSVASAGVPGYPGRAMDEEMAALLQQAGVDETGHISRKVDAALMDDADLVLTFEFGQHMRLLDAYPQHARKVFGVRQFAQVLARLDTDARGRGLVPAAAAAVEPDSISWDLPDPYRRGPRAARAAAAAIDELLDQILPALAGHPVRQLASPASTPSPLRLADRFTDRAAGVPAARSTEAHTARRGARPAGDGRRWPEVLIGAGIALLAAGAAMTIAIRHLIPDALTHVLIGAAIALGGVAVTAGLVLGSRGRLRPPRPGRVQEDATARRARDPEEERPRRADD